MSLDFPTSPIEGAQYSAEGALYEFRSGRWVLLIQGTASGLYLPIIGGTLTGPLDVQNTLTINTNAGAVNGLVEWRDGTDLLTGRLSVPDGRAGVYINKYNVAQAIVGQIVITDTDIAMTTGLSMPSAQSIVNRERGDARYLQLAGGSANAITGIPWITSAIPHILFDETDQAAGGTNRVTFLGMSTGALTVATRNDDGSTGTTIAALARDGSAPTTLSILLRGAADARYVRTDAASTIFASQPDDQTLLGTLGGGGAAFRRTTHFNVGINSGSYGVVVYKLAGGAPLAGLKSDGVDSGVLDLLRPGSNIWRIQAGPSGNGNLMFSYGITTPTQVAYVNSATGAWTQGSSAAAKSAIEPFAATDWIDAIEPKHYTMGDAQAFGFIAEEVLPYIPDAVGVNAEGDAVGLDYSQMIAVLWQAVRELRMELAATRVEQRPVMSP